jgi:uncharacterized protein YndB with AHSA1/START domain
MSISFKTIIEADPAIIFRSVSTREGYQGWWSRTCDVDCALNRESSIRFEKPDLTEEMRFRTIEVKENEKLVWLCTANNVFPSWVNTELIFEIGRNGDGCQLVFTQNSPDKGWKRDPDYQPSLQGWKFFMDSLKSYCETGEGDPWG